MNVVLVDPPTTAEQIYGDWDLSELDTSCPPLGLLHIASFLREHGHQPSIVDMTARKLGVEETVALILLERPEVVGFSAKTINVRNAAHLAAQIKRAAASVVTVLGGSHVTALPSETMAAFPEFDYGVVGEGEVTMLELVHSTETGRSPAGIPGLVWREPSDSLRVNEPRELIANLDDLPLPAWDLLPGFPHEYKHSALETKRLPAASLITSRGCPHQCTFCDRAVFGSRVRQHSAEYTLRMIRRLVDTYGVRDLMFLDDNFILDRRKLFGVCDGIIEERIDVSWYCMGHAKYMTEDRLMKIRAAGCWFIEMGIESGSNTVLEAIKKGTTKQEIAVAVNRAKQAGLKVKGNFIFGFPQDTLETINETIEFARNIGIDYFQQNYLTPWPGCEIARDLAATGRPEDEWGTLAHQRITYVPPSLTAPELEAASTRAFRSFYLRPRIMLRYMLTATSWRGIRNLFLSFLVFLRTIRRKSPEARV